MLRILMIGSVCVALLAGGANAQAERYGIGMMVGEPTGVSGKLWMNGNTAFDAGVAWSFSGENALNMQLDYVFHNFSIFDLDNGTLGLYFGFGGRVKFDKDNTMGLRIPVGLDYIFESIPLDAFFEVVPLMDVIPDTEFNPQAALGVRYFFGKSALH